MVLYSSPEMSIQKLRDVPMQCGIDPVICWFKLGGLVPHRQVLAGMRGFAKAGMPAGHGP